MAGFTFVNDMDLIMNDATNQATKEHGKMQQSLTLWHGLLWATDGDLVPDKCFWYLINFKLDQNKWKYKNSMELPGQLKVKDENDNTTIIPRLEPSEARHMLRVWIAPDGNNTTEANHLRMVVAKWQNQMAKAKTN